MPKHQQIKLKTASLKLLEFGFFTLEFKEQYFVINHFFQDNRC